jgi:ribosome-associated protein
VIILTSHSATLSVEQLKSAIEASLDDDKAEDIVVIDLAGKSSFADYMVVASGRSQRHTSTIADKLSTRLRELGSPVLSIEGKESGDWVLVDCGDIIVHLFRPEIREMYHLEKMWGTPLLAPSSAAQPSVNV